MTSLQFVSHLIELYGMYGLFVLVMIEGDLTLLLAGVLAHSGFFDDGLIKGYGFAKVLLWGTLAGFLVSGCLPVIERCFGIVTDIKLLDLADSSHPLLQELIRRAPGTPRLCAPSARP